MAKFAYSNAKNTSNDHKFFKSNCAYYFPMSYKKEVNSHCKLKLANELCVKLRVLTIIFKKNLYHAQDLQKRVYNKGVKRKTNAFSNKVGLNTKYIKMK